MPYKPSNVLSPEEPPPDAKKDIGFIVDTWNLLRTCDELGGTSWEELEPLERRATECLSCKPPDILGARRATIDALDLLEGRSMT